MSKLTRMYPTAVQGLMKSLKYEVKQFALSVEFVLDLDVKESTEIFVGSVGGVLREAEKMRGDGVQGGNDDDDDELDIAVFPENVFDVVRTGPLTVKVQVKDGIKDAIKTGDTVRIGIRLVPKAAERARLAMKREAGRIEAWNLAQTKQQEGHEKKKEKYEGQGKKKDEKKDDEADLPVASPEPVLYRDPIAKSITMLVQSFWDSMPGYSSDKVEEEGSEEGQLSLTRSEVQAETPLDVVYQ